MITKIEKNTRLKIFDEIVHEKRFTKRVCSLCFWWKGHEKKKEFADDIFEERVDKKDWRKRFADDIFDVRDDNKY